MSDISKQLSKLDIVKFVVSEEGVKSYIVNKDEGPRAGTSVEALAGLKPVFAAAAVFF